MHCSSGPRKRWSFCSCRKPSARSPSSCSAADRGSLRRSRVLVLGCRPLVPLVPPPPSEQWCCVSSRLHAVLAALLCTDLHDRARRSAAPGRPTTVRSDTAASEATRDPRCRAARRSSRTLARRSAATRAWMLGCGHRLSYARWIILPSTDGAARSAGGDGAHLVRSRILRVAIIMSRTHPQRPRSRWDEPCTAMHCICTPSGK